MIHAFKPDRVTNRQEPWRFYDFVSQSPEALHMVTWVKSPWGIPANCREMEGAGVNTYKLVNDEGVAHLVKFHWQPKQGVRNLTAMQAAEIQAKNVGHATQDLYEAIERGEFPEWTLCVQIMSDDPHEELDFDPLDDTKRWREDQYPLLPVGRMVLDRNPANFFAEVEQAKSLPPLPAKPPPGERRPASAYTGGQSEASESRQTFTAKSPGNNIIARRPRSIGR